MIPIHQELYRGQMSQALIVSLTYCSFYYVRLLQSIFQTCLVNAIHIHFEQNIPSDFLKVTKATTQLSNLTTEMREVR